MSFSSSAKEEIAKRRVKGRSEKLSMLCALTHAAGSLTLGRGIGVQYVTESYAVARLIAQLAGLLYGVEASISVTERKRLNARNAVTRLSGEGCRAMLLEFGFLPKDQEMPFSMGHIPEHLVAEEELSRAFIRGAFLGAGSVADPAKGYHLEIVCRHELFARELCELVNAFGFNTRLTVRKSSFALYLKEGEKVSDFLAFLGANDATISFENERVLRSVKNDVNRQNNFDQSNMQKAALAAAQQLIDIELIRTEIGVENLPPRLRQTAEARLNYPEANLSELSEIMGLGRSGVNHRLQKLTELANSIRIEKGEPVRE
ncbi:MAG TPA: DNA-binding protein WhiA [Clostridia bacterium]|nr:DNA-binding protein WhiA [Clostridia bacterium]